MRTNSTWQFIGILVIVGNLALGQDAGTDVAKEQASAKESTTLKLVQNFTRDSLRGAVGITIRSDGRFLYASAYQTAAIHVFAIDQQNGLLTLVDTVADRTKLQGVTDFCLSPDERLGVASAFTSKAATLFQCDPESGKITLLDSLNAKSPNVKGFQWPIRAAFSKDGKFVYVVDSGDSRSFFTMTMPAIIVLKVANNRLEYVESFTTKQGELANARGIAVHPNGKHLFITASDGQSLVSLLRDPETGKLELVKTLRNEPGRIDTLDGVMSVVVDASGQFVTTLAGRFRGEGAIGVFAFDAENGGLEFVEGHRGGAMGLEQFAGGNQLAISPDGLRLYAVGTTNGTLSVLNRETATGKLTPIETIAFRPEWSKSAAGVAVSPNNKFVYVTGAELDPSITVFEVLP